MLKNIGKVCTWLDVNAKRDLVALQQRVQIAERLGFLQGAKAHALTGDFNILLGVRSQDEE